MQVLMVYISIPAVTAAYGFALTASHLEKRNAARPVGASMLAMVVNDDAGSLTPRGALRFFVGTPPGACSLLQGTPRGARKSKAKAKARRPDSRPGCRCVCDPIVGASLLAMDFQAPRSSRRGALSLTSIASRLAPTGDWGYPQRSGRL
jgi:hypothetical protein